MDGKAELIKVKDRLEMYYLAEEKILQGQSYSIAGRTLTRANLSDVQSKIKELETKKRMLEERGTTKRRTKRIVPLG